MQKFATMNLGSLNEDLEHRIALMRSLQNQADLTVEATLVSNLDKIEDVHCGFGGIDEVESKWFWLWDTII